MTTREILERSLKELEAIERELADREDSLSASDLLRIETLVDNVRSKTDTSHIQVSKSQIPQSSSQPSNCPSQVVVSGRHRIHRPKIEERKFVALLRALRELRTAREKTATGRGQKVSADNALAFHTSIDRLEAFLDGINVQQQPTATIVSVDEPVQDAGAAADDRRRAMFGDTHPESLKRFQNDIPAFVNIRKRWDAYLDDTEGSPLPRGWLAPPPLGERWKVHLNA